MYDLEKMFIQLMSDIMRAPDQEEKRRAITLFRDHWPQIPGANALNQIFDLKSWIDSKINGQSFAFTVRKKWQDTQNNLAEKT